MRFSLPGLFLLLAACAGSQTAATPVATSTPPPTSVTTSLPDAPTTTPGSTTTVDRSLLFDHLVESTSYANDQEVDIHAPKTLGPWPVVVSIHGGGWFTGSLDSMSPLADDLAGRGAVVFNATYRTITKGGSFPSMVDDVACAVAYARHRAPEFTTTPGLVTIIGHSAGAHLVALVTLTDRFGGDCPWAESRLPDAMVGLAGPYNTDRLAIILGPFYGTDPAEDPAPWLAGNPLTYVADSRGVPILLMHGDADEVVPLPFTRELEKALTDAGKPVEVDVIGSADHNTIRDPRVVGDRIFEFLKGQ